MKQFPEYTTFFDLGIDEKITDYKTLYCVMSETHKKRNDVTKLALRYLLDDKTLNKEELLLAKSIINDSYYNKPSKYEHCKICSDDFKRIVLEKYSSNFQYWEICFPTVPYFPGNMMIYLKDRKHSKLENVQDMNIEQLNELKYIITDLKSTLNKELFEGNLTGINILFNQLSKSQLCIHGHVELMIKNIDKLNLGCKLLDMRGFDPTVNYLNSIFYSNKNIIKTKEGIRINMDKVPYDVAFNFLEQYEERMKDLIKQGQELRSGQRQITSQLDLDLYNGMSPAPTNSVYITDYRNKLFLSSVPEIIPPTINLNNVGSLEDYENLYLIKYNATTPNKDFSLIKKYSPIVRPSSKIPYATSYSDNVKVLNNNIRKVLCK